ncbi:hypothetical protein AAG906_017865 [Vitis piasezkii]
MKCKANRRIIVLEASPREGSTLDVVKPNTNQQNNGVATGERNGKNQTPRPQNNKDREKQAHIAQLEDKFNHKTSNYKRSDSRGLNKEEIERLQNFLTSLEKPNASYSLARSDKYSNSFFLRASKDCLSSACVIDYGATDHMINSFYWSTSYNPCLGNQKIKVVVGILATMIGQGIVSFISSC